MLTITTPPTEEPVTLADVKANARILASDQDALLASRIVAARVHTEHVIGRSLVTRACRLTLAAFPEDGRILLPRPPAIAVSSVAYLDEDGASRTVPGADYVLAYADADRAWIEPAYGKSWPATRAHPAAVTVEWTAGYGNAATIPEPIKLAMMLLVGHWHMNREASGDKPATIPYGYDALIGPYCTHGWI